MFKVNDLGCSANTITDPNGVWSDSISVPKVYEDLVVNDKNFGRVGHLRVPVEKFVYSVEGCEFPKVIVFV